MRPWLMVKVASAAPAAAHHQGGQPQQAQGSCSCFRHGKHDTVIKFDVVDIHSAVHGAGISKRSSKLGACQGRGGWIPLGNRTCQSAVDIHGSVWEERSETMLRLVQLSCWRSVQVNPVLIFPPVWPPNPLL